VLADIAMSTIFSHGENVMGMPEQNDKASLLPIGQQAARLDRRAAAFYISGSLN
jgi:hypothetical protein